MTLTLYVRHVCTGLILCTGNALRQQSTRLYRELYDMFLVPVTCCRRINRLIACWRLDASAFIEILCYPTAVRTLFSCFCFLLYLLVPRLFIVYCVLCVQLIFTPRLVLCLIYGEERVHTCQFPANPTTALYGLCAYSYISHTRYHTRCVPILACFHRMNIPHTIPNIHGHKRLSTRYVRLASTPPHPLQYCLSC